MASATKSPALQAPTELPPQSVRPLTPATLANAPVHAAVPTPHVLQQAALHGHKAHFLMNQMLARSMNNQLTTATVLPLQFDADTWNDLLAMQTAVVNRLQQQQRDWAQGVTEIMQDYSQIRLANTLSKFVEQEYNLGAQIGALMTSQLSQFVNLMENIQVDYGYWIAQKREKLDH